MFERRFQIFKDLLPPIDLQPEEVEKYNKIKTDQYKHVLLNLKQCHADIMKMTARMKNQLINIEK